MKRKQTRDGRGNAKSATFELLEGRQLMSTVPTPGAAPAGSEKLAGTILGTSGSYKNQGNTVAKVFDGNASSYFDAAAANGDWAGSDLGAARQVTQVQFAPRGGYGGRMVGGVFQGSNTADFSGGVATLFTVTTAPANQKFAVGRVTDAGLYRYVRYAAPAGGYGNVAEIEFDGVSLPPAFAPLAPRVDASATASNDVHLSWTEDLGNSVGSFTVERQGPTDAALVAIATVDGGVNTFDDTSVVASTPYTYAVVATNAAGSSPASSVVAVTTPAPTANPWVDGDIGAVGKAGSATVSPAGTITVSGSGADIWNQTDAFHFNYQTLAGSGSVVTQVTSQTNSNSWAKSGVMLRESGNADARYVLLALTPGNGVTFQARTATHKTPTVSIGAAGRAGVWLKLQRDAGAITGYVSTDGVNWKIVGTVTIPMVNNVLAGVCVSSHDNTKISTGVFANTSVVAAGSRVSDWSVGAVAPMTRWESETFTYNNKLYVFGGFIDGNLDATAECDVYDPGSNTWAELTNVPSGQLTHASVAVLGDTAYFAGGDIGTFNEARGGNRTSTAEVLTYNLLDGVWGSVASLPAPQSCGGLVAINNHLYLYGGLNANDTADLNNTWSLDLADSTATWVARAAMPDGRNHLGSVQINGIAYAVGGGHLYNQTRGNDSEVDAYNPVTDTWTRVASLPMGWSSNETTTLVANGKIVLVGGQTNGGYDGIYLDKVEAYDPATNAWTQIATLPEANEGESAAYINGQLIVADGTVDNLGGWSQNQTWIDTIVI